MSLQCVVKGIHIQSLYPFTEIITFILIAGSNHHTKIVLTMFRNIRCNLYIYYTLNYEITIAVKYLWLSET